MQQVATISTHGRQTRPWTNNEVKRLRRYVAEDKLTTEQIAARLNRSGDGICSKMRRVNKVSRKRTRQLTQVYAAQMGHLLGLNRKTVSAYIDAGIFPFAWRIIESETGRKHRLADQEVVWGWAGQAEHLYFVNLSKCPSNWLTKRIRQTLAEWDDEWLSLEEVAKRWPTSRTQVQRWRERGWIRGVKWGNQWRVRRSEAERAYQAYLESVRQA
jgi:excisionase family DNA binding protein